MAAFAVVLFLCIVLQLIPLKQYFKKRPLSIFILVLVTCCQTFLVGYLTASQTGDSLLQVVGMTAAVALTLMAYVFVIHRDLAMIESLMVSLAMGLVTLVIETRSMQSN